MIFDTHLCEITKRSGGAEPLAHSTTGGEWVPSLPNNSVLGRIASLVLGSLQVLVADPKNAKAMFRRGKAELRLGNTEAAARDLEAAHKLAPEDAAISRELRELRRQLQQDRAAQAELFRGRLPRAPSAGPLTGAPGATDTVLWHGIAQLLRFLQTIVGWFLPSVVVQKQGRSHSE